LEENEGITRNQKIQFQIIRGKKARKAWSFKMTECDWSSSCKFCNARFIGKNGLVARTFHMLVMHSKELGME